MLKKILNYISQKDWLMEDPSDPNECRCRHSCCSLEAKYPDLKNHIKSKNHIAALSAKNITTLAKILTCRKSSASSKVEESVAMFSSCHCAIANFYHLICMLESNHSDKKLSMM